MTGFINPLKPRGGANYSEALARIRGWTRSAIDDDDAVISVTELACADPGCPPRETVILVMLPGKPALKLRVHKAMADVNQGDVAHALASAEGIGPYSKLAK